MSTDNPKALLIVADRDKLLPGEVVIQRRLEGLNYEVAVKGDKEQGLDVRDVMLMVVSSSVVDPAFGKHFRDFVVPIIVPSKELYIKLGMRLKPDVGEENSGPT